MRAFKVGITGGIGAGKSTVAKIFKVLGIPIYDADTRARRLMIAAPVKDQIIALFGEESYINGALNRRYLAEIVFHNKEKLTSLNKIVHPAVASDYENWQIKQKTPYTLKEAALLFESGSYKELDYVINVNAGLDARITRVLKRDSQRSREEVLKIINQQWSDEKRSEKSDYLIENNRQMIIPQVLEIHKNLIDASVS